MVFMAASIRSDAGNMGVAHHRRPDSVAWLCVRLSHAEQLADFFGWVPSDLASVATRNVGTQPLSHSEGAVTQETESTCRTC